jgi:hypothetical protein
MRSWFNRRDLMLAQHEVYPNRLLVMVRCLDIFLTGRRNHSQMLTRRIPHPYRVFTR